MRATSQAADLRRCGLAAAVHLQQRLVDVFGRHGFHRPCPVVARPAFGHALQVAGRAGVDAQRQLQCFALEQVRVRPASPWKIRAWWQNTAPNSRGYSSASFPVRAVWGGARATAQQGLRPARRRGAPAGPELLRRRPPRRDAPVGGACPSRWRGRSQTLRATAIPAAVGRGLVRCGRGIGHGKAEGATKPSIMPALAHRSARRLAPWAKSRGQGVVQHLPQWRTGVPGARFAGG